jgi:hypothetical protein
MAGRHTPARRGAAMSMDRVMWLLAHALAFGDKWENVRDELQQTTQVEANANAPSRERESPFYSANFWELPMPPRDVQAG